MSSKTASRNRKAGPGVNRLSKSELYSKKALYKRPHKPASSTKAAEKDDAGFTTKPVGGAKNLKERKVPTSKAPKFYPSEDAPVARASRKTAKPSRLRQTLTPGTVVILLAGRYQGRRAVFLKQLGSGMLLISGPLKINGVPLRRVNQAYVIATTTKIDLSSVPVDAKFDDAYFSKEKKSRDGRAQEKAFFEEHGERQKQALPEHKAKDQREVDGALAKAVAKVPNLAKYLAAPFKLSKGDRPHLMHF